MKNKNKEIRIPKEKLQNSLALMLNERNTLWTDTNISCSTYIHEAYGHFENNRLASLLKLSKSSLLKRHWRLHANSIAISNTSGSRNDALHNPVFLKYAIMYLAHNNLNCLDTLLHSLAIHPIESLNVNKYTTLN